MRVLVLTHQEYKEPDDLDRLTPEEKAPWKTEYDVIRALEWHGHETQALGAGTELANIRNSILSWKPRIVFNLLEEFKGEGIYVPYVLGYLELMRVPFTGCNPSGLHLTDNKALMKKILRYHRIRVPDFAVFLRGRSVRRPRRLSFPLIVKSVTMHGSVGISQASFVTSDEKLKERVEFIHDTLGTDAIAEAYIDGRELYVGMIGNRRLETLPVWEMKFAKVENGEPRIATSKVKWDEAYRNEKGIETGAARRLPNGMAERIGRMCKRVYRTLGLSGYARMDFRLSPDGKLYLLEPNPNPDLSGEEDFAQSAQAAGVPYEDLIKRILSLGFRYHGGRAA
jgi:D-alanine-D-alanine ligase